MPKFAPVAPIQVLEGLYAYDPKVFGDYHLLLAHHTVAHKKRFKELFKRAYDDGWTGTIIMDNSIVELGDSVDTAMVAEAVNIVEADGKTDGTHVYPVLPDVMGQGHETRGASTDVYDDWCDSMPGDGFMAVCQGKDFQDFQESLIYFGNRAQFDMVKVLGIPRILEKTVGSRVRPAISARNYMESHFIHLLGFSDNVSDDIDSAWINPNCGIDSAVPLRMMDVFNEFADAGKRPPDWFEQAQVSTRMIDNLRITRELFGD
jgi:hypothetical protein